MPSARTARPADHGPSRARSILAFVEHYPNTYKPYLDTQFVRFAQDGHRVGIVALGHWNLPFRDPVRAVGLHRAVTYPPATLGALPAALPVVARELARAPLMRLGAAARAWGAGGDSLKHRLLDAVRAVMLPAAAPDLCLVHNLATARRFGFLQRLYPTARRALYFHGGDIPHGARLSDAESVAAFAMFDVVLTNTAYSARLAVERGCPPERLRVCPVGFDLSAFDPDHARERRPGDRVRLLLIARLNPEKGVDVALAAMRALVTRGRADVELRVVGSGPDDAALREQAATLGLADRVTFLGEQQHERVRAELRAADALLVPSVPFRRSEQLQAETQATVVQEALLMRVPVVASRIGGIPESFPPTLDWLLVPPHDPGAIADAVERLAALPGPALAALRDGGEQFARERYDIGRLNAQLLELCFAAPEATAPAYRGSSAAGRSARPGGVHEASLHVELG